VTPQEHYDRADDLITRTEANLLGGEFDVERAKIVIACADVHAQLALYRPASNPGENDA